jgi:hypothetical protein
VPLHARSSRRGAANLFRMRVLRVFFVAAQFPVDMLLPPGEHELQSPPRALQKRLTLHCDALSALDDRLLHRDPVSHVRAGKPFRMCTYEKRACKPSGIRNYKIIGLKVS